MALMADDVSGINDHPRRRGVEGDRRRRRFVTVEEAAATDAEDFGEWSKAVDEENTRRAFIDWRDRRDFAKEVLAGTTDLGWRQWLRGRKSNIHYVLG
jgi:hypothetical protein